MPHDQNTDARRAWLYGIQFPTVSDPMKTALLLIALLLVLIAVGHNDYEDALAIESERDAYSHALARCGAEQPTSPTPPLGDHP